MGKKIMATVLSACLLGVALPVWSGAFDKGRKKLSVVVSSGNAFRNVYTVIGVGLDYAIEQDLLLGVDAQAWFGSGPDIYKISPQLRYVFQGDSGFRPYAGAFYRATFIDNLDDLQSAGFRIGAYINQGTGYYMGVGYVYETYLNCTESVYNSCSSSYPEFVVSISL